MRLSIQLIAGTVAGLAFLAGCNGSGNTPVPPSLPPANVAPATIATTSPAGDDHDQIVAFVRDDKGGALSIHRSELDAALYDAYGLQFLFDVVELDLAETTLVHLGRKLEPADVERERKLVMLNLFRDNPDTSEADREKAFQQLLERQHLTRAEFELRAVKINACLRKMVEPKVLNSLPDEAVRKGFAQMYGEKRLIADIQVANLNDAAQVKARLAKGDDFALVAQQMSTDNNTAQVGGKWEQPFSSQSPENVVPQVIKDAAFALDTEGKISPDPLNDGKNFHIIKLVQIIPPNPKVTKYDDVKTEVRKAMEDRIIELTMKSLREQLTRSAQQQIEIEQPNLKDQWEKILDAHRPRAVDKDKVLNQIGKENAIPATKPGK